MSQENVEIVQRVYDAVARRDRASILALYDAGVELHFSPGTLADHIGETRWIGHDGLRAFDRELRGVFENFETTCKELIDADDQVVSVSRYRGRGRRSGVEIDGPFQFGVWSIRGGKVTRVVWYSTRREALDSAGIEEQPMSQSNVDRFLECTKAFNRFAEASAAIDRDDVGSWLAFYALDVRFEPQQAALEGSYVGHDGIRRWIADLAKHYGPGHLHFTDVRDLGDRVLALGALSVTGRGSGIEIEAPAAIVATFRGGLITHLKDYGDHDQAREAVGLRE